MTRRTRLIVCVVAFSVVVVAGVAFAIVSNRDPEPQRVCTLIGCGSGVGVIVPASERHGAGRITVCVDADCQRTSRRWRHVGAIMRLHRSAHGPGPASVVLIEERAGGPAHVTALRVRLDHEQPNGEHCPGNCWSTGVVYRGGRLVHGAATHEELRQLTRWYGPPS